MVSEIDRLLLQYKGTPKDPGYEPIKPYKSSYAARIDKAYIYKCTQTLQEDEENWDDPDREVEPPPPKPIHEVDLAFLIKLAPKDIKPNQIKIEFGYNASCMAYEDHYIRFYYEVEVPAQTEEYKAACKRYEENLKKYKQNVKLFEEAKLAKDIKDTEARLAKLKQQGKGN